METYDNGNKLKLEFKEKEAIRVPPMEKTEKGDYFLSNLDQNIAVIMKTIYLYKSQEKGNNDAVNVLKQSLSKVLVYYYPLAGRLALSPDRKLIVDCTGEGPLFVEAEVNCSLVDLLGLASGDPMLLDNLVYQLPGVHNILDTPIFTLKVTKFNCGAFALGMGMNHCMSDGKSTVDFLNSWGKIARGLSLIDPPHIDRTILRARDPPRVDFAHNEFLDIEDVSNTDDLYKEETVCKTFTFDLDKITRVKHKTLIKCSTFEALSGLVWRARCKALRMNAEQETKLLFAADGRSKFEPPLPNDFFGNGMVLTVALSKAGALLENPLCYTVELVQNAIALVTDSYMRSVIDYIEINRDMPSMKGTLLITSWVKLPFYSPDFGWGNTVYTGPVGVPGKEVAVFLAHAYEKGSISLHLTLPVSAMNDFEEEIMQI